VGALNQASLPSNYLTGSGPAIEEQPRKEARYANSQKSKHVSVLALQPCFAQQVKHKNMSISFSNTPRYQMHAHCSRMFYIRKEDENLGGLVGRGTCCQLAAHIYQPSLPVESQP
jgi:hypothetical protein